MSGSVIDFRSASARRVSHLRTEPREAFEPRETRRQRASRKRNPLRHPCHHVHIAVTIAGKLHRGEPLNDFIDEIAWLRRGALAARLLADALDGVVKRVESQS